MFLQESADSIDAGATPPAMAPPPWVRLKWMTVMETGIPELDDWHRRLIDGCNELMEMALAAPAAPEISTRMEAFVESFRRHFRCEERLMKDSGFPRLREHAAEHRRMEEKLQGTLDGLRHHEGTGFSRSELLLLFGASIAELLIRCDLDYRSHLLFRQGR